MIETDILLINLSYDDIYLGPYFPVFPPLGLAYMASVARRDGFKVFIYDAAVEATSKKDILSFLDHVDAKIVGISVYSPTLRITKLIINHLRTKKNRAGLPFIVVGAHHIFYYPDFVVTVGADFGIRGEAEYSFNELSKYLLRKEGSIQDIPGLIYHNGASVCVNDLNNSFDINGLPFPSRDLFNHERYYSPFAKRTISTMMTSRGCPYRCSFCAPSSPFYQYIKRDIGNTIQEIDTLTGKVDYIEFLDDTFTYDYDFLIALCNYLLKLKRPIQWACQTRADLLTAELIELMGASGCIKVSLGLETADDKIRKALGKDIDYKTYERVFYALKNKGIYSVALLMFGHHEEKKQGIVDSLNIAMRLADIAIFQINRVHPGTDQFNELLLRKELSHGVWNEYMNEERDYPYYINSTMTLKEIERIVKRAYLKFYFSPHTIMKWAIRNRTYRDFKHLFKIAHIVKNSYIGKGKK